MNCRNARNLVQAHHDMELQPEQRVALQTHLHGCRACSRFSRASALTERWLHEMPVAAPAASFEWRLKLRLAQLDRPVAPPTPVLPAHTDWLWPFVASTAAAAVLVLTLGLLWNHGRAPAPPALVAEESLQEPALRPWAPNPADGLGRLGWPRLVPVRAGAPLGPEVPGNASASILGATGVDTAASKTRLRTEPIQTQPVRY